MRREIEETSLGPQNNTPNPMWPSFTFRTSIRAAWSAAVGFFIAFLPLCGRSAGDAETAQDAEVAQAAARVTKWDGPTSGPPAARNKTIVYLSGDLRNGGVLGVANGIREAAEVIGWKLKIIDLGGGSDSAAYPPAISKALELKADGVILAGTQDATKLVEALAPLAKAHVPILAWHNNPVPGPVPSTPVLLNVTTDPLKVARVAARAALSSRGPHAGVVIFTESRYSIAKAKAFAMADVVKQMPGCKLLEICDAPFGGEKNATELADLTRRLLSQYGTEWTHALAINDVYFDHATPVFAVEGLPPESSIVCVSAGDGSVSAYARIQAGLFQTGTVAEPLNLQGWQLVDEMNRVFCGVPLSGYVTPMHYVNAGNIAYDGGPRRRFDPDNDYRDAYRRIWKP